jgi:hypothetical protein
MNADATTRASGATAAELRLADPRGAAGLAAYLARLLRYDRAAAVRVRSAGSALAVFGRPPLGERAPIALRTVGLSSTGSAAGGQGPGRGEIETEGEVEAEVEVDATVSAGELLEALEPPARGEADGFPLPAAVTGPAWTGMLPPRSGWSVVGEIPADRVVAAVRAGVEEFRRRTDPAAGAAPGVDSNAVADEIWSRPLELPGAGGLPLRAAHAAQVLGFLSRLSADEVLTVHRHPAWMRLNGPYGAVAVRRAPGPGAGLGLTPVR